MWRTLASGLLAKKVLIPALAAAILTAAAANPHLNELLFKLCE